MDTNLSQNFSSICGELCNLLYLKEYNKSKVNSLLDDLNSKPYKGCLFVRKHDATALVTALSLNIRPEDEFLAAKTSHLVKSIIIKQNLQFEAEYLWKVISWHIQCLKKCSDIILPDILHNMQCILQINPLVGNKFVKDLLGSDGVLKNLIDTDLSNQNTLQISLIALKCISCCVATEDSKTEANVSVEVRQMLSELIIKLLLKDSCKRQDEFLYCKVIISALRVLSQLYYNEQKVSIPLPEVIGICHYFILYGIAIQGLKPEKIMPAQQTIAAVPMKIAPKGGKKQKIRKQRNNAIESLKKEIPVSDRSLLKDVDSFENTSAYKPVSTNFLEPQRANNGWVLTSDSDMSDIENSTEAKLIALKSRVRQSASNLLLVLVKTAEKKDMFGYWWALLPDSPDEANWSAHEPAKKSLAYCAVNDPIAASRASVLSVILAMLSGSRVYLSQAEASKKDGSFIPFSVSLGYVINCMHIALVSILDSERSPAVIIVALKCCAALVQATPYHKMKRGLIGELVRATRRFLVHRADTFEEAQPSQPKPIELKWNIKSISDDNAIRYSVLLAIQDGRRNKMADHIFLYNPPNMDIDVLISSSLVRREYEKNLGDNKNVTLQVGALITMGCVLSVDPKVDEVLESIKKDAAPVKTSVNNIKLEADCEDFEEGYSDDEMFVDNEIVKNEESDMNVYNFDSWIFDICFRNMGWSFRGDKVTRCQPSAIPVLLESLQVLSAAAFHQLAELLARLPALADALAELLRHDHLDVLLQAARTASIVGDALQKLEQLDAPPPLNHCVYFWETLLPPLSAALQCHEDSLAKAVVCDCIANVGARVFKELPRRRQMACCALLVGSSAGAEPRARAAAVRALAMLVMYPTLREDICFVSDCGENILRALAEPALVVRTKAAWALANLSDALVLNLDEPEFESVDDDLLRRLLEVSMQCAGDNDKVKMSATRGLGNFLRLITNDFLKRNTQIKALCEAAIGKLLECSCKVSNMKVRWNACYALGNAMKNEYLFTCFTGWQRQVFPSLCTLCLECKNLKVRINAAVALRAPSARAQYGAQLAGTWRGVMAAMETAANVDDFTEYRHKDNLIEQLCVTLAHMCCLLTPSDLPEILDPLVFHFECAKALYTQLCHRLLPENSSCMKILQAAKYVTVDLTAESQPQQQALAMLQDIFIWDMNQAISTKVCLLLRYLATGSFLRCAGDFCGVSQSAACRIVKKVTVANAKLSPNISKLPNDIHFDNCCRKN